MLVRSAAGTADHDIIPDQEDPETLAVWTFRRWVLGVRHQAPEQWDTVWRGLRRRCGERAAREASAAMAEMIEALRRTSRRTITHHQPCCPCVGDDEALLLVLLGACQRNESALAWTAARTLSGTVDPRSLVLGAMRFADAFAERGLTLPPRDLPDGATVPEGTMVH
ncbi:hypothetical protein N825_06430 [Skermanella stibiiresistens SB22]|uniref:Uncharacterized protein n=2 Tax=Skermanella TaxID=204447 RepID=W9GZX0_9PROT|nr:hypothetical protein N825_06430 [Skermanella stibiiresistens SB22]